MSRLPARIIPSPRHRISRGGLARLASLSVVAALLAVGPGLAEAQKRKKKPKPKKEEAAQPAEPAEPAPAPVPPEATEEFKKGQAAEQAGDLDAALTHYETAFSLYPDPVLQLLIGEAHRKRGEEALRGNSFDVAITEFEKAQAAYQKYLELAPEGAEAEAARNRAEVVAQYIENTKIAQKQQQEEEKKRAEEEAEEARRAEEERRRAEAARSGAQLAMDGIVVAGVDQDATAVARLMAGGLLGWGRFAFEGHLSFEGFLRVQNDKGVSARSVTLLDLGLRLAFADTNRFRGPFVSLGGGFGLFSGRPRERKLEGDMETCAGFEDDTCAFGIDKNISTRFGLGYGFEASKQTTVAVRLDAMYWLFSVDDEQEFGAPPAGRVEKPQTSLAFVLGLEFLHWP